MTQPNSVMTSYRWNAGDAARAYDAAAEHIHPHYVELQDKILGQLMSRRDAPLLVVDAGGGSGRLMERVLDRLPRAQGVVLDQSESYLELAAVRLGRFGQRATVVACRLQDDWAKHLPGRVDAILSMSAIHHLEPEEKRRLYADCYDYLAPAGQLLNGDEVRPTGDDTYLEELRRWDGHMTRKLTTGAIPESFGEMLSKWRRRNIDDFGGPRQSGDDCHETIETQVDYLHEAGFATAETAWQREMWAVIRGAKASE